jgi:hypothetical protein
MYEPKSEIPNGDGLKEVPLERPNVLNQTDLWPL